MLSSRVKRSRLLWLHNKSRLLQPKLNGRCNKLNITWPLNWRFEISPPGHVISSLDHMLTCIFTFYGYITKSQRELVQHCWQNTAPVSQRSWIRIISLKPRFFSFSLILQLVKLCTSERNCDYQSCLSDGVLLMPLLNVTLHRIISDYILVSKKRTLIFRSYQFH